MRFAFKELPGSPETVVRPVVPVSVEGLDETRLPCLLDTGSLHNRFARWVADEIGAQLDEADEQRFAVGGTRFAVGGTTGVALLGRATLSIGDSTWQAPVWFCDPWPYAFQILGQEGFFRFFDVTMRARVHELDIEPTR